MIEVRCRLLEPGRAVAHDGVIRFYADGVVERDAPYEFVTRIDRLSISERVGAIPRRIEFDDGTVCEVDDNDAIDRALQHRPRPRIGLHRLESRWRWVAAAVALTVAGVFLLLDRGVPVAAHWVASGLSPDMRAALGERSLKTLDRGMLSESAISAGTRSRLRRRAEELGRNAGLEPALRLEFRASEMLGANALALPGGIVVATDGLIELAERDEEVLAVIAHEVGHLHARHALRTALQNTGIAVLMIAVSGDVSWLATVLPSSLLAAKYSRDFEREADRFAVRTLQRAGIDPAHFARMLRRLVEAHGPGTGGYLSSHPAPEERLEALGGGGQARAPYKRM